MSLVKTGKIADCCTPNALMTLKEYLEDYASPETRALGEKMISKEVPMLLNERVRRITEKNLARSPRVNGTSVSKNFRTMNEQTPRAERLHIAFYGGAQRRRR